MPTFKVYIFVRRGMEPPAPPPGVEHKVIVFEDASQEDLHLVAQYLVVNYPTCIMVDHRGKAKLRVRGPISASDVDLYMDGVRAKEQANA